MYHATPDDSAGERPDYFGVGKAQLLQQVQRMRALGVHGVSMEALLDPATVWRPSDRAAAITFDDAHLSNFTIALPVLRDAGFTATVFVVAEWVGRPNYCSWSQLRELHAAGWSVQSHTMTHPFLSVLSATAAIEELRGSRERIEQELGAPVVSIALPNGDRPKGDLREVLDRCGYRWAATSRWGPNGLREMSAGIVNRYTVRRDTDAARFDELVLGRSSSTSLEGLRLRALNELRSAIGPTRYRRIRQIILRGA